MSHQPAELFFKRIYFSCLIHEGWTRYDKFQAKSCHKSFENHFECNNMPYPLLRYVLSFLGLFYRHKPLMISDFKSSLFDLGLAALSVSRCVSLSELFYSIGELLLLTRRAAGPSHGSSLLKFPLYLFIIVIMKCYEEKMSYSYVMVLLFHKYF